MIKDFNTYINEGRMSRVLDAADKEEFRKEDTDLIVSIGGHKQNLPWTKEGESYTDIFSGEEKTVSYKKDDLNIHLVYNDQELTAYIYNTKEDIVDEWYSDNFDKSGFKSKHGFKYEGLSHCTYYDIMEKIPDFHSTLYISGKIPANIFELSSYKRVYSDMVFCDDCDFSLITDYSGFFHNVKSKNIVFNIFPFNEINTCERLFSNCGMYEITISGITNKCTRLREMFHACDNLKKITFENCDFSNVDDVKYMFHGCEKLIEISGLDYSFFSGFKEYNGMFSRCKSLQSLDLSAMKAEPKDVCGMFYECESLVSLDMSGISSKNLTDKSKIDGLFSYCKSLKDIKLSEDWNTTNIKGCYFELPQLRHRLKRAKINYKKTYDDYE